MKDKVKFLPFYWENTWPLVLFSVSICLVMGFMRDFRPDWRYVIYACAGLNILVFIGRYIDWKRTFK